MTDTQFYILVGLGILAAIAILPFVLRAAFALLVLAFVLLIFTFGIVAVVAAPILYIGYRVWDAGAERRAYRKSNAYLSDEEAMRIARDPFGYDRHNRR